MSPINHVVLTVVILALIGQVVSEETFENGLRTDGQQGMGIL